MLAHRESFANAIVAAEGSLRGEYGRRTVGKDFRRGYCSTSCTERNCSQPVIYREDLVRLVLHRHRPDPPLRRCLRRLWSPESWRSEPFSVCRVLQFPRNRGYALSKRVLHGGSHTEYALSIWTAFMRSCYAPILLQPCATHSGINIHKRLLRTRKRSSLSYRSPMMILNTLSIRYVSCPKRNTCCRLSSR